MQDSDILRVAITLFAKYGFAGTSIRDIAEALGVHPPSIFHHFGTKAKILEALIGGMEKEHLERYARINSTLSPAPALHRTIWIDTYLVARLDANLRRIFSLPELRNDDAGPVTHWRTLTIAHYDSIIRSGIRRGDFRKVHSFALADALYTACESPMWCSDPSLLPEPEQHADQLAEFALRGLLREPQRLEQILIETTLLFTRSDLDTMIRSSAMYNILSNEDGSY